MNTRQLNDFFIGISPFQAFELNELVRLVDNYFEGSTVAGFHRSVLWHVEQFAWVCRCRSSSGFRDLWHFMHYDEAVSRL
jgi:hypothetical protein